jgi:hypothetical protein
MKLWIPAVAFAVLAMICIIAALNMPWYWQKEQIDSEILQADTTMEFKLQEVYVDSTIGNISYENTIRYTDEDYFYKDTVEVFNFTFFLAMAALVMIIPLIILIVYADKRKGRGANIGLVFGALVLIAAILAPAFLMFTLPGAFENSNGNPEESPGYSQSFAGSEGNISWGGGTGWYLAFVPIIFIIITMVLLVKIKIEGETQDTYKEMLTEEMIRARMRLKPIVMETEVLEMKSLTLQCPKCLSKFKVKEEEPPFTVICPDCGARGEIDAVKIKR